MPITPTTFTRHKLLSTTNSYRAYADVYLLDPASGAKSPTFHCLVDTGSDYTILPRSAAAAIGLIPSGPSVTFRTAGGATYTLPSHTMTAIVIEGYLISGTVAFSSGSGFSPVIGRLELISAFDIGMDTREWHYD